METSIREQLIAEFVGTFIFVFVCAGSVVVAGATGGALAEAVAQGIALAIVVTAVAHISGGHVNPAVTVGAWVAGRIETVRALLYILVQLAGGAAGAWVLSLAIPKTVWQQSSLGATLVSSGARSVRFTSGEAVLLEAVMTFFLVFVVFATALDERGAFRSVGGFAIGLVVAADILIGGPLTGASMNPARSFGPALVAAKWTDFWIYVVGPLAGGVAAALVYWLAFLRRGELEAEEAELEEAGLGAVAGGDTAPSAPPAVVEGLESGDWREGGEGGDDSPSRPDETLA